MSSKKCAWIFFLWLFTTVVAMAQSGNNVHYINMSQMLIYVLPFYAVTILALGLFIHKLMRPSFPSKWLYICSFIGIFGAGVIAYQFHDVRTSQLPSAVPSKINTTNLSEDMQEQIHARESNDLKETISNYWVVAIPNFILLALGLGIEWVNKKQAAEQ